jgi:osmotically-inducible protein OsmY
MSIFQLRRESLALTLTFGLLIALAPFPAHAGILEDRAIEDAIESSYVFRSVLTDRSMVHLYVRQGAIEVRGQAADERERALLARLLANIPNVVRVDNQLFVDSAGRRDHFRWRAARLLAALRVQKDLDVAHVQLESHDGTLDLVGTTTDAAQSARIEARVRALAPSERITNRLRVEPTPPQSVAIDDASIIAMVHMAIESLTGEKDSALRIISRAGEVVIDGAATSPETINAITQCAEAVRGVRVVHNQLKPRT